MSFSIPEAQPIDLGPQYRAVRARAASAAARFTADAVAIRAYTIEHGAVRPDVWQAFRETGCLGSAFDGPEGAGLLGAALVLEAFAERGIVLWMPVLSIAIARAIDRAGPQAARTAWLPGVASGSVHLAMAATEPESGHNLFAARTEIRAQGDDFSVSGRKRISSGVDLAERVLVLGRTDGGHTTVLVDPRSPGVTVTEVPMRYREGVRQYQLDFEDVVVPAEAVVGTPGQGMRVLWTFAAVERILTAALCTGSATYALDHAVAHAKSRVVTGSTPIGAHQAIAHPLARLHARAAAVRLLVWQAAAGHDAERGQDAAGAAEAAKVLASDLAFDCADHAVQVLGAEAWDERNGWLDHYLDARLSRSGPVSNEFALNHLAERVLGLPAHR
ncbi:acyl-CoA dehydrogenase family protein [Nocardia harenae]|uniref:acyl-CoA dehydrogenase family protein n=1 Tax=Nocardia harenae TaxID=358707 RepID=UPI00082E4672|nr:acyl-CoA dehydrogenase family protein [Nocardia harenae]